IETELSSESEPWLVEGWLKVPLEIVLAFVVVWLNSRLMPSWAAFGTLMLLTALFLASFFGLYYGVFRMEFLPLVIGVWIEQLVEGTEHAQHVAREHER